MKYNKNFKQIQTIFYMLLTKMVFLDRKADWYIIYKYKKSRIKTSFYICMCKRINKKNSTFWQRD